MSDVCSKCGFDYDSQMNAVKKLRDENAEFSSAIKERDKVCCVLETKLAKAESDNAQLAGEVEQLNKALALKLDALPSGLSAGQSMKIEADLQNHKEALEVAKSALKLELNTPSSREALAAINKALGGEG